jgi:hypothetical protein
MAFKPMLVAGLCAKIGELHSLEIFVRFLSRESAGFHPQTPKPQIQTKP